MFTSFFLLALTLKVASSTAPDLMDPESKSWDQIPATQVALNRTPPLYDTDPPSEAQIGQVEVRLARVPGKLLVRMSWQDRTQDAAEIAKKHTQETGRFFDGAAVMWPARTGGVASPSLQMGDAADPVHIYYWNAARGAMVMAAGGRGTTKRLNQTFPARGVYRAGAWRVTLELPEIAKGVPLSFAVWNGAQQDRDGRKYFSVWHWLE